MARAASCGSSRYSRRLVHFLARLSVRELIEQASLCVQRQHVLPVGQDAPTSASRKAAEKAQAEAEAEPAPARGEEPSAGGRLHVLQVRDGGVVGEGFAYREGCRRVPWGLRATRGATAGLGSGCGEREERRWAALTHDRHAQHVH